MITKQTFWDKKIPTLLGLLLIIVGIGTTTYLAQIGIIPFIGASPGDNPKNIRVTNVSDTSFTVTYTTDESAVGSVSVTSGSSQQLFLDDRDNTNTPLPHFLHSITVKNLQPKTVVSFSILSGKSTYLNKDVPFTQTTGDKINQTPTSADDLPVTGKVVDSGGETPPETLLYITTDGGQTISTFTNPAGLYATPLLIRSADLSSFINFNDTSKIQLLAVGINGQQSQVIFFANSSNPVPTITLSQNYDFTQSETPIASGSALPVGFPSFGLDTTIIASESPKIDVPQQNETFVDPRPVLHGKVLPNEVVSISIHSDDKISTTVKADQYGNWTYQPPNGLSPGAHTISITSKDQNGILKTVQSVFTILESGTQVAEAATPSATLTPRPPTSTPLPPSLTPTPTKISPQLTPGASASPVLTATPTLSPTNSVVSETSVPKTSPTKEIPSAGSEYGVFGSIVGIAATFFGIAVIFFTHIPL